MKHLFQFFLVLLLLLAATTTLCHAYVNPKKNSIKMTTASTSNNNNKTTQPHKILVLGSSGFLGQQIVQQLDDLGIPYIAATRQQADLTSPNAIEQVAALAQGCDAVISTVGSLGNDNDETINASNAQAAKGAQQAGTVQRFVAIGNDPKIRAFSKQVPGSLQKYAQGKEISEKVIKECFPDTYTIVQPTFIHGGNDFAMNPPRIPSNVGQLAEDILGLYPFQSASEQLPGVLGLAFLAPISRERVATACINGALGLTQGDLDSRDDILRAASKRTHKELVRMKQQQSFANGDADTDDNTKEKEAQDSQMAHAETLKQQLYTLGDCGGDPEKLQQAFDLLEQIEDCNVRKPTTDGGLNGRWDFVMDIEADIGTGVVKDILNGNSPIQAVFDLNDLYMMIEDNRMIKIYVKTKVLGMPVDLVLSTLLIPDDSDVTGTTFLEQFQGIELGGREFPVPKDWQRSRPLEFSYLDDTMLVARGNGAEPHYLKRG